MSKIDREALDDIIVLKDMDGNEVQFEYLETVHLEDSEYVVLLPLEDITEEEEGQVVILEYRFEGGDDMFLPVEDDETLQEIFEMFKAIVSEKYNLN